MTTMTTTTATGFAIDPSRPLRNVIVCCTSIPPDQRVRQYVHVDFAGTEIAQKVAELGGIHKYDLTPDVTHLIVGDYDTPKYRHVARERPDIKAMDATWIQAMTELWKGDEDMDLSALEKEHQLKALERSGTCAEPVQEAAAAAATAAAPPPPPPKGRQSLLICLTGFGEQRDAIAAKIAANGGHYSGDLTRRCTHLIVSKPEGKKFTAAKSWGVYTVTLEWLDQSLERGMILDEAKFDPLLPVEEQGVGAWVKLDDPRREALLLKKRSRSSAASNNDAADERGAMKLRRTASLKLNSQRHNLWGDILGRSGSREYSLGDDDAANAEQPPPEAAAAAAATPEPTVQQQAPPPTHLRPQHHHHHHHHHQQPEKRRGDAVFAGCVFATHGFDNKRLEVLENTITTLGGSVASSIREAATSPHPDDSPSHHRFLIVPQTSKPDARPRLRYDNVDVITEFYIEKCLHSKHLFPPQNHVLGRPFPLFPIPGFSDLVICSAAFTGVELSQIARSIPQLGGRFEEEFRRTTSVLVCRSLSAMRKDKLKYALEWGTPVVSADWLWNCISAGLNLPFKDFILPELVNQYPPHIRQQQQHDPDQGGRPGGQKSPPKLLIKSPLY